MAKKSHVSGVDPKGKGNPPRVKKEPSIHQIRKEEAEKREAIIQKAILEGKNKHSKTVAEKERQERKSMNAENLYYRLYYQHSGRFIRKIKDFICQSYNPDKAVIQLIRHLYVKYQVPQFMYRCMIKTNTPDNTYGGVERQYIFCDWFISLAQGESFPKKVKGIMTKQEASVFLKAPNENMINQNVWWAKMTVAGIPQSVISKLVDRIFKGLWVEDPSGRYTGAILFYAKYHEDMDKDIFNEITDFINEKLRNDATFSFKGRTLTSIIKLSNDWHYLMQRAKLGDHIQWQGMNIPKWEFVGRNFFWDCIELTTNKDLATEGKKQAHCVYGYVDRCRTGGSAIFSLRKYTKEVVGTDEEGKPVYGGSIEQGRVTIEVYPSSRQIVQARGRFNKPMEKDEKEIFNLWAGKHGFTGRGYL